MTAYQSATLPQGHQSSRCGGAGLLKPSRLPWIRKGGCHKVLPGCRRLALARLVLNRLALICLALIRLTLIRFALNRFAAFARQWAMSPQGGQPSRYGGAPAPTVTALFE